MSFTYVPLRLVSEILKVWFPLLSFSVTIRAWSLDIITLFLLESRNMSEDEGFLPTMVTSLLILKKKINKIMPNWHDLWKKILTMYDSSWDLTSGYSGPIPDLVSKLKTNINIFTWQRLPNLTQSADTCDQVNIVQSTHICNTVLCMVLSRNM